MQAFARRSISARSPALLTLLLVPACVYPNIAHAQTPVWQLWASGLPAGYRPRIAVAPDHSVYYGLLSASAHGILYKAGNALAPSGSFVAMPAIPYVSITNNIAALTTSANSEPVVGIFHGTAAQNLTDPIAFVFDAASQQWIAASVTIPANLGVFAMVRAPNGDLWFGAKWGRVYRSTDNGRNYTAIDETALVAASAPCYYPAIDGNPSDGAIYSINVDRRGWVYAGTEGAGVVYSNDRGMTWQPVDAFACDPAHPTQHNLASPMEPITHTGNTGAIGFTLDNNVVWNGTNPYIYADWPSSIGYADVAAHTTTPALGFLPFFIATGLQTQRIVTTTSGMMFLHSGPNGAFDPNPPAPPQTSLYSMGLYSSSDGIHWTQSNTGITGNNNGGSEGSLAVDGNRVFTATSDGKIWYLDMQDVIFADGFGG
jgi:hypothetical protein